MLGFCSAQSLNIQSHEVTSVWPSRSKNLYIISMHSVKVGCLRWQGTVEEKMEAVQARKQRMISGALTDQEVRSARLEELKMLFT